MSARLKGRLRLVKKLLSDLVIWAQSREDVEGMVMVGSYARGTAGMASDVDIVILTPEFERLAEDVLWVLKLRPGSKLIRAKAWGPLLERRFRLPSDLQLELGLVSPSWADVPLDPGTLGVLADRHQVIYERHQRLSKASEAVGRVPTA